MIPIASAEAGVTTATDAAVDLILNPDKRVLRHLTVINETANKAFFSIDGGTTWLRLEANARVILDDLQWNLGVKLKRVPAGANPICWAYAW